MNLPVYDVTEYARDHPGGLEPLMEIGGQDATSAYEDVGHSEDAREIMHTFLVGVLEGAPLEQTSASGSENQIPDVQIVKRYHPSDVDAGVSKLWNAQSELLAFAVGTAGLAYFVNSLHLIPSLTEKTPDALNPHVAGHGGFTRGFTTACAAFGAVSVACVRYLAKADIMGGSSFSSYPAHIKASKLGGHTFHPAGVLKQSEYMGFKLRHREECSDGIYKFVFDLPTQYSILGLPIGQHVAVKGIIDEHTVVRSYTPISNNRDLGRLELLIRVYPGGQIGNYLKDLKLGEQVQIRGPKGAMKYRRGTSKSIGMIGGGTGITPLYQLIRAICEDPNDNTQVTLIYGNRSESDIMLKDKLDGYARTASHKFKVHYVLDQPGPEWKGGRGHVTKELLSETMPKASPDSKMLLCGPPGMVNAMKKNLVELGFEGPGAVSKMSDQIFCF